MSKYTRAVKGHKRKISHDKELGAQILQKKPRYVGNPRHKRNPGNFGLRPPSAAVAGKNLCDDVAVFTREIAQKLLETGLRRGFFSTTVCNGWPRNVWALSAQKIPLEARLDQDSGTYHGFPLSENDPLYAEILKQWENSDE